MGNEKKKRKAEDLKRIIQNQGSNFNTLMERVGFPWRVSVVGDEASFWGMGDPKTLRLSSGDVDEMKQIFLAVDAVGRRNPFLFNFFPSESENRDNKIKILSAVMAFDFVGREISSRAVNYNCASSKAHVAAEILFDVFATSSFTSSFEEQTVLHKAAQKVGQLTSFAAGLQTLEALGIVEVKSPRVLAELEAFKESFKNKKGQLVQKDNEKTWKEEICKAKKEEQKAAETGVSFEPFATAEIRLTKKGQKLLRGFQPRMT